MSNEWNSLRNSAWEQCQLGGSARLEAVSAWRQCQLHRLWNRIVDAMIFAMAFPNVLGLYFLSGEVRKDLADYFKRIKSGEIKAYK